MNESNKRQVPIAVSVPTYVVMLGGSMFAVFFPLGLTEAVQMIPFFALGFKGFCGSSSEPFTTGLLIVVNAIFLVFLVCFIRVRSWSKYGALCCGFGVFLLLNIAGWLVIANALDFA